ncbi:MAG: hypothetical protein B6245_17675 [Desulfobacteraceae bacterium 4572_88]|nr:MAG: hypothetical protein B6245_17675 [Desulfobacteraceae bacterium 4572_88]
MADIFIPYPERKNVMQKPRPLFIMLVLFLWMVLSGTESRAEDYAIAPVQMQAALFMKLLSFHEDISGGGDISIHIVGAPDFAAEMQAIIGEKIGNAKLAAVSESQELPSQKPSVIYAGDVSKLDAILRYTRENSVLSITGIPKLVLKGVSLGIGVAGGKPKILLNISSSKQEGVNWNHAILKVSTTF